MPFFLADEAPAMAPTAPNATSYAAAEARIGFLTDDLVMVDRILVDECLLAETEGTVDIQPLLGVLEVDVPLVVACCDDVCDSHGQ